ncbi:MAG: Ppx/GppA family phosphatase [Clostridia bacterium]|nr:Ppx/GppA family phosphatase [Clostridia bacterium]
MRAAVIGIGSNSVRSLLADVSGTDFRRLKRDREGTRLFAGLDADGNLNRDSMDKTVSAVRRMASDARRNGAEKLAIFATSAARDAANGQEFMAEVERETGEPLRIISGEEEAELSFMGASAAAAANRCGMIDIGGGSTEIAIGTPAGIETAFSCQMGAVRLYRRLRIDRKEDMKPVEVAAAEILNDHLKDYPEIELPEAWVGTGGTFTTLAAMVLGQPWTDRTHVHGATIAAREIREIGETLAGMKVEDRIHLQGLQPSRADIVVHGICILLGVMERLGMDRIIVSEWGNLDGYFRKYFCESIS